MPTHCWHMVENKETSVFAHQCKSKGGVFLISSLWLLPSPFACRPPSHSMTLKRQHVLTALVFCVLALGSSGEPGPIRVGRSTHSAGGLLQHHEADPTKLHRPGTKRSGNSLTLHRGGREPCSSRLQPRLPHLLWRHLEQWHTLTFICFFFFFTCFTFTIHLSVLGGWNMGNNL